MTSVTLNMPPMRITENLLGLWFVVLEPGISDWLCGLYENPEGNETISRIRYLKPVDKKKWFKTQGKPCESISDSLAKVRAIAELVVSLHGKGTIVELHRGDMTADQFALKLKDVGIFDVYRVS